MVMVMMVVVNGLLTMASKSFFSTGSLEFLDGLSFDFPSEFWADFSLCMFWSFTVLCGMLESCSMTLFALVIGSLLLQVIHHSLKSSVEDFLGSALIGSSLLGGLGELSLEFIKAVALSA